MNKTFLLSYLLLIGLQTSKIKADDSAEEVTINADTTEPFTEQQFQIVINKIANDDGEDEKDEMDMQKPYDLPADSESIRPNIIDSQFKCDEKEPGYYADVENECQIFHRCLEGRSEVYSFICPERTLFDQRVLVCIWDNYYDFECSESAKYYQDSNRAFLGNITAEENMMENIMNSHEFKSAVSTIQQPIITPSFNEKEEFKLYESSQTTESSEEENLFESTSRSEEVDSNDYQAELIPSSTNHLDASIATSSDSISASLPQKISLFVDEPIMELPAPAISDASYHMHESMTNGRRNIRKRSKNHRNRFLFKADTAASLAH